MKLDNTTTSDMCGGLYTWTSIQFRKESLVSCLIKIDVSHRHQPILFPTSQATLDRRDSRCYPGLGVLPPRTDAKLALKQKVSNTVCRPFVHTRASVTWRCRGLWSNVRGCWGAKDARSLGLEHGEGRRPRHTRGVEYEVKMVCLGSGRRATVYVLEGAVLVFLGIPSYARFCDY